MKIVSPQCAFSDVFQNHNFATNFYHNGYIGMASRQCLLSYILQDKGSTRMPYHKGCIEKVSPQYEFSGVSDCVWFSKHITRLGVMTGLNTKCHWTKMPKPLSNEESIHGGNSRT